LGLALLGYAVRVEGGEAAGRSARASAKLDSSLELIRLLKVPKGHSLPLGECGVSAARREGIAATCGDGAERATLAESRTRRAEEDGETRDALGRLKGHATRRRCLASRLPPRLPP